MLPSNRSSGTIIAGTQRQKERTKKNRLLRERGRERERERERELMKSGITFQIFYALDSALRTEKSRISMWEDNFFYFFDLEE